MQVEMSSSHTNVTLYLNPHQPNNFQFKEKLQDTNVVFQLRGLTSILGYIRERTRRDV